jgi:hypothetical protein
MQPSSLASRPVRAVAILVCVSCAMLARASDLSFLAKSPVSYFKPADTDLMKKNAQAVLDAPESAAKQSWSNPKTGASGLAEVKAAFTTTDGTPCKRLRVVNKAKKLESEATYTFCKYQDRGWIVNADAQPAQ